jgi:hypothetical protein
MKTYTSGPVGRRRTSAFLSVVAFFLSANAALLKAGAVQGSRMAVESEVFAASALTSHAD